MQMSNTGPTKQKAAAPEARRPILFIVFTLAAFI
jgi:hypothetical protein